MGEPTIEQLKERVLNFEMLQLPGQSMGMHMGTSCLVSDLLRALLAREAKLVAMTAAEESSDE